MYMKPFIGHMPSSTGIDERDENERIVYILKSLLLIITDKNL
jgi:hypothetical protein